MLDSSPLLPATSAENRFGRDAFGGGGGGGDVVFSLYILDYVSTMPVS